MVSGEIKRLRGTQVEVFYQDEAGVWLEAQGVRNVTLDSEFEYPRPEDYACGPVWTWPGKQSITLEGKISPEAWDIITGRREREIRHHYRDYPLQVFTPSALELMWMVWHGEYPGRSSTMFAQGDALSRYTTGKSWAEKTPEEILDDIRFFSRRGPYAR